MSKLADAILELDFVEDPFFVQIGGYDGKTFDPIYRTMKHLRWPGLICEPIPAHFNRLMDTYANRPEVRLANIAISDQSGLIRMSTISEYGRTVLPEWMLGSSTLTHRNLLGNQKCRQSSYERILPYLERIVVMAMSWDDLVRTYGVKKATLVQVDTEGHDYAILSQINFGNLETRIVHYEHNFLTPQEQEAMISHLVHLGFKTETIGIDTLAIR